MSLRRDKIRLDYSLVFSAGFHCGTGLPNGLIHRSVQRDPSRKLIVPGSTFKGTLRNRCEQLAQLFGLNARTPHDLQAARGEFDGPDVVARVFGSRVRAGELYFDDLRLSDEDAWMFRDSVVPQTVERQQMSLSRLTRTAKPGLLFASEAGLPDLRFRGAVLGFLEDVPLDDADDAPTYALLLLLVGMMSLDRLGGTKSTGSGKCRVEIDRLLMNDTVCDAEWITTWLDAIEYLEFTDDAFQQLSDSRG